MNLIAQKSHQMKMLKLFKNIIIILALLVNIRKIDGTKTKNEIANEASGKIDTAINEAKTAIGSEDYGADMKTAIENAATEAEAGLSEATEDDKTTLLDAIKAIENELTTAAITAINSIGDAVNTAKGEIVKAADESADLKEAGKQIVEAANPVIEAIEKADNDAKVAIDGFIQRANNAIDGVTADNVKQVAEEARTKITEASDAFGIKVKATFDKAKNDIEEAIREVEKEVGEENPPAEEEEGSTGAPGTTPEPKEEGSTGAPGTTQELKEEGSTGAPGTTQEPKEEDSTGAPGTTQEIVASTKSQPIPSSAAPTSIPSTTPYFVSDGEVRQSEDAKPVLDPNCQDNAAANCLANQKLCKNRAYFNLMKRNCPETCGHCVNSNTFICNDRYAIDCQNWGPAFCSSRVYTKGMKLKQCAKFCNLC